MYGVQYTHQDNAVYTYSIFNALITPVHVCVCAYMYVCFIIIFSVHC